MKSKISSFLAVLIGVGSAFSVSAREFSGKISNLITWQDGHSIISIENAPDNGCMNKKFYSLGVKGKDVKAEPMLTTALAAYLSGRTVRITTENGGCQGGEEKIIYIQVLPN